MRKRTRKKIGWGLAAVWLCFCCLVMLFITGCGLITPPTVYAGQYFDMKKDSKPIVQVGTNGSQANAIHAAIGAVEGGEGQLAEADKNLQTAKSSALFNNNTVGDRSADVDATTALEMLKDVQGSSAAQGQTTSKGDTSPATGGAQTQTPTQTETRTTNVPISVSQGGANSATSPAPQAQPVE